MRSALPKVLHKVAGLSLVGHALRNALAAQIDRLAVVIGPDRPDVRAEILQQVFEQHERLGTAHAALQARPALAAGCTSVILAFGDTPLVRAQTLQALADAVERGGAGVAVMGFRPADPTGYGRILLQEGTVSAIREHKDANAEERAVPLCNGGLMALAGAHALALLEAIDNKNAQSEYYLTDCVALARARGLSVALIEVEAQEALGVNDRAQLAQCEGVMQTRLREHHLLAGVTLHAPETVFFAMDTHIAADVVVEPHVVFGQQVVIETGAVIHAFSHLEGARVGQGASVGPFARLRPGTVLGADTKVGNFVEIKNTALHEGAKASHLSYLGDAEIGAHANIGAGTITCNYDGYNKYRTIIGAAAFIGSNSALVAPVSIGAGALVGAGSTITQNVPADALALTRAPQQTRGGWAAEFRTANAKGGRKA